MQCRADQKYYNWIKTIAIPSCTKNIQYFLQMLHTVKQDITTNDEQICAIHAMSDDPYQSPTLQNMTKMRQQIVKKLQEYQEKLDQKKKNSVRLYRLKEEHERKLNIPQTRANSTKPNEKRILKEKHTVFSTR